MQRLGTNNFAGDVLGQLQQCFASVGAEKSRWLSSRLPALSLKQR